MARYLQGVRGKKILQLQNDNFVTELRHCTVGEYEEIFGAHHKLPEDEINTPSSSNSCPNQTNTLLMDADCKENFTNIHRTNSPNTCDLQQEENREHNTYPPLGYCCPRRELRSWSLSDLTEDTVNMIDSFKKTLSLPVLSDINNDNPDNIMIAFNRETSVDSHVYEDPLEVLETDHQPDYGNISEGRKRRHTAEPKSWKRNKAQLMRMRGEEYLGYSNPKNRKFQQDTVRQAKQLGPTCISEFCKKSKNRGCERFTEQCRMDLHNTFWKKMTWDQRRVYVTGLVTRSPTSRKTKSAAEVSRREGTLSYFLPTDKDCSIKVQVCKQMFLNTLSLGSFTVQSWVKKSEFGMTSNHETIYAAKSKTPRAEDQRKLLTLNNFFTSLPKLPSHYARKDTTKLLIEPVYLYKAYLNYCLENDEPQASRFTFEKNFYEKNLSLFTLKKDMCDTCSSYKSGNTNESDYEIHVIKKNRARQEKADDKIKAAAGKFILLTMDLEAVKVCPYLTASALYFKTKLTCHNFTVFNLITKHTTCYWFDETAADLTSSTFATFLIDYLERHCIPLQLPIVIYSDGCPYQNRNAVMANALLF